MNDPLLEGLFQEGGMPREKPPPATVANLERALELAKWQAENFLHQGSRADRPHLTICESFNSKIVANMGKQGRGRDDLAGTQNVHQNSFVLAIKAGQSGDARKLEKNARLRVPCPVNQRMFFKGAHRDSIGENIKLVARQPCQAFDAGQSERDFPVSHSATSGNQSA